MAMYVIWQEEEEPVSRADAQCHDEAMLISALRHDILNKLL